MKGEEVSLDVQGVRGRVLCIGRAGLGVKDGDEVSADVVARWLIGTGQFLLILSPSFLSDTFNTAQTKVNLRPIWSPAADALGKLSERFGNLVWELIFQEVQELESKNGLGNTERDGGVEREGVAEKDDPWEEERSWRDPAAHQLRSAVSKWLDGGYAQAELLMVGLINNS